MGEIWYGGTIYTMREENEKVEAIYVENGVIVHMGNKEELENRYSEVKLYDLKGKTMIPGLVDSHMHLIGHGERLLRLDLSNCKSYSEVLTLVQKRVEEAPKGSWIIGEGWNENNFTDTKQVHVRDLDEISKEHPILLKRVCRHVTWVNSYILQEANIIEATQDPKGGKIGRDSLNKLTGLLYEQGQELIKHVQPEIDGVYLQSALQTAISDCWQYGLVGGHTEDLNYYGGFQKTYNAFSHVIKEMRFKAHLLVHHEVANERKEYENEHYIEFGAMKIFSDGSFGGRTALLSEPYEDAKETNGVAIFSREELAGLVKKARDLHMPVAIHTIGDLSLEYVIDALELYPPAEGLRDRIIHCQLAREELIERMKHLPAIIDIQPVFVSSDFPSVIEKLGERRLRYAYAWKTLLDAGLHCNGGSDAPIEQVNPFLGIYSAVTRRSFIDGVCYMPEERLTVYEAVSLFTTGSAYAIGKEAKRGKIAKGYEADFTILDRNIFEIEAEEIKEVQAEMTVVDGKIVYRKDV
ncbi:putative N-substituted formamide deformylase, dihydropyrimidinase or isoaspartyl peptidase [Bacillus mycoides]|uniref:Putative N-substituted formamide deformylase, dihydropyrimidinase or isoaspartyl peptidase n=1 Tax=Bacillus mycoides TaxID=1405 RepID=A0A653RAR9_BACMY|nr:amidohydrolase [Bacillus mycoides]VXB52000.1 putative N-substituted formamide deformylase, dihydropyrimidinase or isoaspartyl peptidase [Bacillus mycoides]